jgi:hypothetical protein
LPIFGQKTDPNQRIADFWLVCTDRAAQVYHTSTQNRYDYDIVAMVVTVRKLVLGISASLGLTAI